MNVLNSMENKVKNKSFWSLKELLLMGIYTLAIISLLSFVCNGIDNAANMTDRPNQKYADFQQFYFPAAMLVFKNPEPVGGYFYTPTFALMLYGILSPAPAKALLIWKLFQYFWLTLLLLIPALYLGKKSGRKIYSYIYLASLALSMPVYHNLNWGQISIMLMFCSIFSLILYDCRKIKTAAFFLALASCVKYYPAFVLVAFLFKKEWKFILWFLIFSFLLGVVLPGCFLGFAQTVEFYRQSVFEMSYALDWVAQDINSQFFAHVFIRLLGLNPEAKGVLTIIGLILVFVFLVLFYKRIKEHEDKETIIYGVGCFLLFPFLINTSWPHYFVALPFCAVFLMSEIKEKSRLFLPVIALLMQSMLFLFIFDSYKGYSAGGFLFWANLMLLVSLAQILQKSFLKEQSSRK
ncbi:MAG: glycosyltransferase family 87 protein [Candidatus Rifleibacteriota bacterium]